LAEVSVALKSHVDAMQDSICDAQSSLTALVDFLVREQEESTDRR
jgi:hypothetical protein